MKGINGALDPNMFWSSMSFLKAIDRCDHRATVKLWSQRSYLGSSPHLATRQSYRGTRSLIATVTDDVPIVMQVERNGQPRSGCATLPETMNLLEVI